MTKSEFIQQAALVILGNYPYPFEDIEYISKKANALADKLYPEEENTEQVKSHNLDIPIRDLAAEIGRLETKTIKEGMKKQISGAQIRFLNVCKMCNIKTVGDLIKYGFFDFSRETGVGKLTIRLTTEALHNLYNINWI
jgi:hypothetical protein